MDYSIFTEPQQGASYDTLLAVAQAAEQHGFGGFFRSDHYLKMGDVSGLPGPTHAWVTLAGLARDTERIRLGTLVSPITFHDPGSLAIMVAQVDDMSGGRIELGIGAGWYEAEHAAYGLPFPDLGERMNRLEEGLEQMVGLWATAEGDTFDHDGAFHQFTGSPALPKPMQRPNPPIVMGGRGKKRTPALVAKYADEFNLPFVPFDEAPAVMDNVRQACANADRDPDSLRMSAALVVCAGATEAEVERRAAAIGREPAELRENGLAGSPEELADKIGRYAEIGVSRIHLQLLDLTDLDHLAHLGATLP